MRIPIFGLVFVGLVSSSCSSGRRSCTGATGAPLVSGFKAGPGCSPTHQIYEYRLPPAGMSADVSDVGVNVEASIIVVNEDYIQKYGGRAWDSQDDVEAAKHLVWQPLNGATVPLGAPTSSKPFGNGVNIRLLSFAVPAGLGQMQVKGGDLVCDWQPWDPMTNYAAHGFPDIGNKYYYGCMSRTTFNRDTCPHPAAFWFHVTGDNAGYYGEFELAFSEPMDWSALSPSSVLFTYNGQTTSATSIRGETVTLPDGEVVDMLFAGMPSPIPFDPHSSLKVTGLVAKSGAPMAGNFWQTLSCAPSDFTFMSACCETSPGYQGYEGGRFTPMFGPPPGDGG